MHQHFAFLEIFCSMLRNMKMTEFNNLSINYSRITEIFTAWYVYNHNTTYLFMRIKSVLETCVWDKSKRKPNIKYSRITQGNWSVKGHRVMIPSLEKSSKFFIISLLYFTQDKEIQNWKFYCFFNPFAFLGSMLSLQPSGNS